MRCTRRDFGRLALAVPVAGMAAPSGILQAAQSSRRGVARFSGYPIPQGSDTMSELAKCVRFVEEAVATT